MRGHTTNDGRGGFTLIELLIAAVAGLVLLSGIFQILLTNQRIFVSREMEMRGRQSQLAGLDILFAELREVSPEGGDIIGMGTNWVTIRTQRGFGLACAADNSTGDVTVMRVGEWFEVGDSLFVFADGQESLASDDAWLSGLITAVDTTATCGANEAQVVSLPGMQSAMVADSVRQGAAIRSFVQFTYALAQDGAEWYLTRQEVGGPRIPVAGPLLPASEGGLAFAYLDAAGTATRRPTPRPARRPRPRCTDGRPRARRATSSARRPSAAPCRTSSRAAVK